MTGKARGKEEEDRLTHIIIEAYIHVHYDYVLIKKYL